VIGTVQFAARKGWVDRWQVSTVKNDSGGSVNGHAQAYDQRITKSYRDV